MKIELDLFASFKKYLPEKRLGEPYILEIDNGTTVKELLDKLSVPSTTPKIIFVNGRINKEGTILKDGDKAGIFPQVAGG